MQHPKPFSEHLRAWLASSQPKTAKNMEEVFGERSFAIIFLLFMALPALPIPTGGITHIFETVVMIISLELIIGFQSFWLPAWLKNRQLPRTLVKKVLPIIMRRIQWVEKYSRVRGSRVLNNRWFMRLAGVCIFASTFSAFVAIPFSGLDTLPALGVVVMSLGLIVDDIVFFIAGVVVGAIGIIIELTVGAALFTGAKRLFASVPTPVKLWIVAVFMLLILTLILHHLIARKKSKTR